MFSAIWVSISHPEMSNVIISCIYHPLNDSNNVNLKYNEDTLSKLTSKHGKSKFIFVEYFNRIPLDFSVANSVYRDM